MRADRAGQAAEGVQPPDLVGQQEQRRDGGGVVGLVLGGVVDGDRQVEEAGDPAARRLDLGHPRRGRRPTSAPPRARRRRRRTSAGRSSRRRSASMSTGRPPAPLVASMSTSASVSAPCGRCDRGHDAGGGLVVRPAVDVDAVLRLRQRQRAGVALGDHRVGEERRLGDARGELRGELAEGAEGGAVADQAEERGVPERRRPPVAEHDLVAVGQVEQVGAAPRGSRGPGP